jgi:hypothetical protein
LQYRLVRAVSQRTQIGCNVLLFGALSAIAGAMLLSAIFHPQEENLWVPYAVGSGFALAAVLRLVKVGRLASGARIVQTVVEVAIEKLRRGEEARFFFRQDGPLSLQSLSADLVGAEIICTQSGSRTTWTTRPLAKINFLEIGATDIPSTAPMECFAVLNVPAGIDPTSDQADRRVNWTIEVEGKAQGHAAFQHVYRIEVI